MAATRDFHAAFTCRPCANRCEDADVVAAAPGSTRSGPCAFIATTTWNSRSRSARRAFCCPSQFVTSVRNASSFALDSFNSAVAASIASFISALTDGFPPAADARNVSGSNTSGVFAACVNSACAFARSDLASSTCFSGLSSGLIAFLNAVDALSYSSSSRSRS